ncbi:MAG: right-handed parallel beta-helix repeat-containing protein, partial [Candidatus Desantisbacteria bacterium]
MSNLKKVLWVLVVVFGIGFVLPLGAGAGQVTVYPGGISFSTIQAGVDACPVGGTVSVSAGTYCERVYVNKGIALVGIGTPIIDSAGLGSTNTVTFDGIETADASISGFKIVGTKTGSSAGICCKIGSSPTIRNNTITGSVDGISCSAADFSIITNNTITGNSNGISCSNSFPTISNNTITGNSSYGIYCSNSSPTITNNTITGNNHGIYCNSSSSPAISNNMITGNNSDGIYCRSSSPAITNNMITGNSSHGIFCNYYSSPTII